MIGEERKKHGAITFRLPEKRRGGRKGGGNVASISSGEEGKRVASWEKKRKKKRRGGEGIEPEKQSFICNQKGEKKHGDALCVGGGEKKGGNSSPFPKGFTFHPAEREWGSLEPSAQKESTHVSGGGKKKGKGGKNECRKKGERHQRLR